MIKTMQGKIIFLVTIIAVLFFAALLGYTYTRQRSDLFDSAIEHSMDVTLIEAEAVSMNLQGIATSLELLADHPKFKVWDEAYIEEELQRFLVMNDERFIDALYIRGDGVMKDTMGNETDIKDLEYYDLVLGSTEPYSLTRIGIEEEIGVPCFCIGVQVRDTTGQVIGALAVSLNVEEFAKEMESRHLEGDSYSWITDDEGTVVVHPLEGYSYHVSISDAEELGYEGFADIATRIISGDEGFGSYYDHNIDESKVVTYTSIPGTPGWSMNITTVESDIYGDAISRLLEMAVIACIFIIIALSLIYIFTIKAMKPIKDLTESVAQSRNLGFKPIAIDSGTEEIVGLVKAFNDMTNEIHGYTHDLESLVTERTEEIETVNQRLNLQNEQLASAVQNLNVIASVDNLTGLKNRMALFNRLEYLKKSIQLGQLSRFSLLFMDLDNFKYFNDTFGHDVGDEILKDISQHFRDLLRDGDFIARYGGDEFVVLLDNTSIEVAEIVGRKIIKVVDEYNKDLLIKMQKDLKDPTIELDKSLGLSVGIIDVTEAREMNIDELVKEADALMYKDKEKRKDSAGHEPRLDFSQL